MSELAAWSVIETTQYQEKPTNKAKIPTNWKSLKSDFPMSFVSMQCLGIVSYSYSTEFEIDSNGNIKINFPSSIDYLGIDIYFTQLYRNELSILQACGWNHRGGGVTSSAGYIERNNSETILIQSVEIEDDTIIIDTYSNSNTSKYFNDNSTVAMNLQLLGY